MANDLTKFEQQGQAPAPTTEYEMPLMNEGTFNHMYRVGSMMARSPLFPEHLRKGSREEAEANGMLVVNMAVRLREDPLTVAQNIYFVGGKPGWNATYMISKANQHGVFKDPIDWDVKGEGESLSVTAHAVMKGTGKRVEATASFEMAKAEGWTRNQKYKSMPEQMLRYRSATMLIRLYCPEVMVGIPAAIEVETGSNMRDVTPDAPADLTDALPEAPAQAARGKIDRTPPPAAQDENDEPDEQPDPAARVYGQPDGIHSRRTKEQMQIDTEIDELAEKIGLAKISTDSPATEVLDDLRARVSEAGDAETVEGEAASQTEAEGPDPKAMIENIELAKTEEALGEAVAGAGDLPPEDQERVRKSYRGRLLELRDQSDTQSAPQDQDDPGDHAPTIEETITRDLKQVNGADVETVLTTYDAHLQNMESDDPAAYERVMDLAEKQAAL